jgi:hypothetical protein
LNALARWVALWNRREGGESLALVRVSVGLVVLFDLAEVARFGLVEALWAPREEGAMSVATYAQPVSYLYRWVGASAEAAWLLYAGVVAAAVGLALGLFARFNALVLLLAYAELERLAPSADRGIDTLLRNVLCVLVFAGADATLSLRARVTTGRFLTDVQVLALPRYLIVAQLTLLYFSAGMLKQAASWHAGGGYAALFMVLHKPHVLRLQLPHEWLVTAYPLLQAATLATVVWERAAIAVPILMWARATAERGRVRAWLVRLRLFELWVTTGIMFHLSLAALLALGIFPWGCLALYPALARPTAVRAAIERWVHRTNRRLDALATRSVTQ